MEQKSKEQMRADQAQADKEAMPEKAKMARTDMDRKVLVRFGNNEVAVVHVTHQGEPHPKGFSAVIVTASGGRVDGEMRQKIVDSAIDFAKGKKPELFVEEMKEELQADGKPANDGAGTQGNALSGQGAGAPPAATPPSPNAGAETTPATPGN